MVYLHWDISYFRWGQSLDWIRWTSTKHLCFKCLFKAFVGFFWSEFTLKMWNGTGIQQPILHFIDATTKMLPCKYEFRDTTHSRNQGLTLLPPSPWEGAVILGLSLFSLEFMENFPTFVFLITSPFPKLGGKRSCCVFLAPGKVSGWGLDAADWWRLGCL